MTSRAVKVLWALGAVAVVLAVFSATTNSVALSSPTDTPCDLVLHADIDGGTVSGDLDVTATEEDGVWTYSVNAPPGYTLGWLDGEFPVTSGDDTTRIGGGQVTRGSTITGEFAGISGCFTADAE